PCSAPAFARRRTALDHDVGDNDGSGDRAAGDSFGRRGRVDGIARQAVARRGPRVAQAGGWAQPLGGTLRRRHRRTARVRDGNPLTPIVAIAWRELLSLFATHLGYIVGTLFLLRQGWNFALLLRVLNDPLAAPGPVMQFYFGGSFFIFWLP